ncbi:MAG: gamma carbonic anhydrase family protein [Geodermatophilales bacterium]|nr:gamma carbonic anhydrase family protein [Geodermatophilales bacterium]
MPAILASGHDEIQDTTSRTRHPEPKSGKEALAARRRLCWGGGVDNYIAELDFGAPKIDSDAFVAPTAVVVGAVTMSARSSIWYGAVARADHEVIEIGEGSNVQDGCTLHSDPGFPLLVGRGVTVGHRVVLHGARIDDDVLVGMGSVVMNGAHVASGSIVAAGAVVTPGTQVPPGSVVAGVPAKVVRQATDDDLQHIRGNAASYTERLAAARRVRPVVRRPLPPAGYVAGDDME